MVQLQLVQEPTHFINDLYYDYRNGHVRIPSTEGPVSALNVHLANTTPAECLQLKHEVLAALEAAPRDKIAEHGDKRATERDKRLVKTNPTLRRIAQLEALEACRGPDFAGSPGQIESLLVNSTPTTGGAGLTPA